MKRTPEISKNSRWGLLAFVFTVFLIWTGLVFTGCSDSSMGVAPEDNQVIEPRSFFDEPVIDSSGFTPDGVTLSSSFTDPDSYEQSKWIRKRLGGFLRVWTPDYVYRFLVKRNSIPYDTTISIKIEQFNYGDEEVTLFEFKPNGLKFDPEATLKIRVRKFFRRQNDTPIEFYSVDEQSNIWVYKGTYYPNKQGIYTIPVNHFSKYGISKR